MSFPTIVCRIAFATAPFAVTPTWVDVSADVLEFATTRGRQQMLDRIEAGTLTLTLNNAGGHYWKDNAAGDYYPDVDVAKRINLRATYNSITYDLFTGFISSWTPQWRGGGGRNPVMVVRAVDLLRNMSLFELPAAGYAQQRSDVRYGAVLDSIGWPAADRDLNVGQSTMIATGALANVKAQAHMETVQESELGIGFVAGDGDVQFHDRHARLKSPYLASSATFGAFGTMFFADVELTDDDQYIRNDIRITRDGGTEQIATDATSITDYGQRTLSRQSLLMTTDGEALDQADFLLSRYKDSRLRAKSMTILPGRAESDLYPKVLSYDLSRRITLTIDQADIIDREYHIEGVSHQADAVQRRWVTRWQLSDADSQDYWVLGTSTLGETTRLAY